MTKRRRQRQSPTGTIQSATSTTGVGQPATTRLPWYRHIWVILTFLGGGLYGLLIYGPTMLENAERLPRDVDRVTNRFLGWYYEDESWNGGWSASPEGYVDAEDMELSSTDLALNLRVGQGEVGGEISIKTACQVLPLYDFLLLDGTISGDTATITAFDFIGGKRENFFRFTAKREGIVLTVALIDGSPEWMPEPVRIALHPEGGEASYVDMSGFCGKEREEFMKKIRPPGLEKGVRRPIN